MVFLIMSFSLSPVLPVLAEIEEVEVKVTEEEVNSLPPAETSPETPPEISLEPEVKEAEVISIPTQGKSAEQIKKPTKFKKDSSLGEDAELALVKKHLEEHDLPEEIINRVDEYKVAKGTEQEGPGLFRRMADFVTGTTEEQKEEKAILELAEKQPFQVEASSGEIETAREDTFNQKFSNRQEESAGILQKIKSFFETGTLKNIDINNTKKSSPVSWLWGPLVFAASDNPSDYLAPGGEIVFSKALKDEADSLTHDPLSILNFVRNDITYVPYFGSKKGAEATLAERAGNDTDKAALLIAMLRYSNVPARYRQVDVKMDIGTVTDLLGVRSALAAAQVFSLNKIPYILFTDNENNPLFFVVEHTYVEAYMPYGYSRGASLDDGGDLEWVPMDPSVNAYYYEQPVDIVEQMRRNGFQIEEFFADYLNNGSSALEPINAFREKVSAELMANPPTYYPDMTYDDVLMRSYPKDQNLSFIPGTLPYEVVADIDTYGFVPDSLRHTISFNVKNEQNTTTLNYVGNVSDFADQELLMTYDPATQADQDTLDTFETIYDVVPLSLVAVKPTIKVGGTTVATGDSSTTLGQNATYTMEWNIPTRVIGESVSSSVVETVERKVIAGNTDAIALNTDRIVPGELRPREDTATTSFVANQKLYKTGVDYLYRLQNNQEELARITGGDIINVATRAMIFNGIDVTYSGSTPYSFSWKGLRIDSSSKVKYFNRVNSASITNFKEFTTIFGLQASQEESNIFENNFDVESVATVKGLKLVSAGTFGGVTLKKITSANENEIDSLAISENMKNVFHAAVGAGETIFTPSSSVTYGTWTGLFYININFNKGEAGYIIGEGLNGGFTVEEFAEGWRNFLIKAAGTVSTLTANILNPTGGQMFNWGDTIPWKANYFVSISGFPVTNWQENLSLDSRKYPTGSVTLRSGYGTNASVNINIKSSDIGTPEAAGNNEMTFDEAITKYMNEQGFPPGVLKAIVGQESGNTKFSTRYEPCVDISLKNNYGNLPYSYWIIGGSGGLTTGDGVLEFSQFKDNEKHYTPKQMIDEFSLTSYNSVENLTPTVYEVWNANRSFYWYCTVSPSEGNYPAQFLVATSYGKAQVLYNTAIGEGFNKIPGTTNDFAIPKNPWYLFYADDNIHMAAKTLRTKYNNAGSSGQGYVANDCKVDPLNNTYFSKTYGSNWKELLKPDYKNQTPLWTSITNLLATDKDRLWWAVRRYNGLAPSTIGYANEVCGSYHSSNP